MNLTTIVANRIYHSTGLYPVGAYENPHYLIVGEPIETSFLYVIKIKPLKVSSKEFTNDKLANDIKLVAELDQNEQVSIDVHKGFVCIQIPKPLDKRGFPIYGSQKISFGIGLRTRLGLDILGEPVDFNFGDEMNTNLSFLGVPGSGKSISMRRAITALAHNNNPYDVKFLMIEVSKNGIDLRIFEDLAHLYHPVIVDSQEAERALFEIQSKIRKGILPFKLVICIDEVAELIKQRPATANILLSLVSQGRAMNVINMLATQITDKDTIGHGRAIFRQIHNTVLGKVSNKQLSYILGNQSGLKAEALVGKGDLLLNSSDSTVRFAGAFTSPNDIESLPKSSLTKQLLHIDKEIKEKPWLFEKQEIPDRVIAEGLISLQDQLDNKSFSKGPYYVMAANKAIKLGRNPETFKTRDQPRIVGIYKELRKRGVTLCKK